MPQKTIPLPTRSRLERALRETVTIKHDPANPVDYASTAAALRQELSADTSAGDVVVTAFLVPSSELGGEPLVVTAELSAAPATGERRADYHTLRAADKRRTDQSILHELLALAVIRWMSKSPTGRAWAATDDGIDTFGLADIIMGGKTPRALTNSLRRHGVVSLAFKRAGEGDWDGSVSLRLAFD